MLVDASGEVDQALPVTDAEPARYLRIPYIRRCVLRRSGRSIEAVICDLSVLGVYVTLPPLLLDDVPEPGEVVEISFLLPGDPVPVEGEAAVTWQNPDDAGTVESLPAGCGLRFVSLRPRDHHRIEVLVDDYRRAPTPQVSVPKPVSGFVRIPYVRPCLLVGDATTWEGVLCNLSLLGAYVTVDPIPPAGQSLRLMFTLSGGHPIDVRSEVAWVNPDEPQRADSLPPGCGLRFDGLDEQARDRLAALIAEYESIPRPGVE